MARELGQRQEVDKEPLEQELKHVDKELADLKRKKKKYFVLYENDELKADDLTIPVRELSETEQRFLCGKQNSRASCILVMQPRYRLRY
ncbi:hypothetical protein EDM56_14215 [Brevibacillus fluminis]|uniref:Uncharacterized protein n=1 Tax=Brevibacillus fluminis TaxID=511487 RepID=A0A3M8DFM5_9BACL|nr:hypothetical protein [Brevibacillus fluminis]RNB86873.1 hypothetical protein EDM56_14215 [Brevibacillus fluminis]